jgi:hypothetical protein
VDKDGNEVTRSGGVTTPEGIYLLRCDIYIAGVIQCAGRKDKGHERNGAIRPHGGARVPSRHRFYVATLAIAAIIITAKRMSFLQMSKMY